MKQYEFRVILKMNKLIFLLLFNGLYGYVLHNVPTSDSEQHPINVEIKYTGQYRLESKNIGGNIFIEVRGNEEETTTEASLSPIEQWSVVWYVASFGGLIAFFLIVSCSEWCCRRNARTRSSRNNSPLASAPVTPPPSYDQFAPPTYDSLNCARNGEKSEYDIYVVPVHALGTILSSPNQAEDDPPSYVAASDRQLPPLSLNLPVQVNQSA